MDHQERASCKNSHHAQSWTSRTSIARCTSTHTPPPPPSPPPSSVSRELRLQRQMIIMKRPGAWADHSQKLTPRANASRNVNVSWILCACVCVCVCVCVYILCGWAERFFLIVYMSHQKSQAFVRTELSRRPPPDDRKTQDCQ